DRQSIRERPAARPNRPGQPGQPGQPNQQAQQQQAQPQQNPAGQQTPAPQGQANPAQQQAPHDPQPAEAAEAAPKPEQPEPATPAVTPGATHEFRSEKWGELYGKRIDDTIAALKAKNVPVIWVGLPPIRGTRSRTDLSYLNDLYRARAQKAGITFVDVWDGFV